MNKKYLAFSLAAIFLFFVILEGFTRLFTVPGSYDFIERAIIQQGLKVRKQPDEFRVFLFGESTMQGTHLFPKSTIKKWMEIYLEDLLGEAEARKITIINFGRLGCGSRFMLQAFKDTLEYKPDLVVFYSAHNNFIQLELRDEVLKSKPVVERFGALMQELVKKSSFISTMKRVAVASKIKKSERKAKTKNDEWYVEEEKKFNPATDLIQNGSDQFEQIRHSWEQDIRRMIQVAQKKNIPVIFFEGVSKYKDFKPFYFKHSLKLNPDQLREWENISSAAEQSFREQRYFEAMTLYQQALTLDDGYALTYFQMGQCLEQLADYQGAYQSYIESNEKDYMPIRAPKVVNLFYDQLAVEKLKNVYIIPTQRIFDQHSQPGLVDDTWVADQLHPTMKGQALMAQEILKVIFENHLMKNQRRSVWSEPKSFDVLAQKIDLDQDFQFDVQLWLANYVGSYLDTAEQYLIKALQIKPQSIRAKSQLAWVYWKAKRLDEAKKLYQELIGQDRLQADKFLNTHPDVKALAAY